MKNNWQIERRSPENRAAMIRSLEVGEHTCTTITADDLEGLDEGISAIRRSLAKTASHAQTLTGHKYATRVFRSILKDGAVGGVLVVRIK